MDEFPASRSFAQVCRAKRERERENWRTSFFPRRTKHGYEKGERLERRGEGGQIWSGKGRWFKVGNCFRSWITGRRRREKSNASLTRRSVAVPPPSAPLLVLPRPSRQLLELLPAETLTKGRVCVVCAASRQVSAIIVIHATRKDPRENPRKIRSVYHPSMLLGG